MKKLLFVLAIGSFAACNNAAETATEAKVDSVAEQAKEEVKAIADSATAVIDSTAAAVVDSAAHNHAH